MKRVLRIVQADDWDAAGAVDRIILDADDRHRRRIVLVGDRGTSVLLDLTHPVALRDGDGLVLEDGSVVLIAGQAEPLLEIAAATPTELIRLAWHLGNRHTDVQFVGAKLRIRRDHVLEEMLRGLGGTVTPLAAPFDPETGASGGHHHNHDDDHGGP